MCRTVELDCGNGTATVTCVVQCCRPAIAVVVHVTAIPRRRRRRRRRARDFYPQAILSQSIASIRFSISHFA